MHFCTNITNYIRFPGPPRSAAARGELLDFMVQGEINRGRHLTIQLGTTPSGVTTAHLHHPPITLNVNLRYQERENSLFSQLSFSCGY